VPVRILTTGPGQVNAVQALTAAIEGERPALILQTGCAGAFALSGLGIGDIGIATEEIDVHLGIEPREAGGALEPLPFPVGLYGQMEMRNRYPLEGPLTKLADEVLGRVFSDAGVNILPGPFLTVSTITATDRTARKYHHTFAPCMESMEGAAAARVAIHYRIPFLEIRSASNLVGKRDRDNWNLALAFERCGQAVKSLLQGDMRSWLNT
jgi:futalosine hydrolase